MVTSPPDPLGVRKKNGYMPQASGETMGGTDPSCLEIEELAAPFLWLGSRVFLRERLAARRGEPQGDSPRAGARLVVRSWLTDTCRRHT